MAVNEKAPSGVERIVIFEREHVDICGWHVSLASIWIYDGIIRAEIEMWHDKVLKPISGGYMKSDEIEIGTSGCTYYLCEIKKFGKNNEKKGYIVLSKKRPEEAPAAHKCLESESIEATTVAHIGDVEFGLGYVYRENDGKLVAQICPPLNSLLGEDFDVVEGDIIWVGECAYKVEKLVEGHRMPNGRYENGYMVLKKCRQLLSSNSPVVIY